MRGPEDIGCSHCTKPGAATSCTACSRLVCAECASNVMTCETTPGFELHLGAGSRVRAIDPSGRIALVTRALRDPRLLDLRTARWLGPVSDVDLHAPVLTDEGTLLVLVRHAIDAQTITWTAVRAIDPRTGTEKWVEYTVPQTAPTLMAATMGTHVWYPTRPVQGGGYSLGVIRGPRAVSEYPLPYPYPIDAAAVDSERERFAVVGGNRLAVYQMARDEIAEIGAAIVDVEYTPRWLGLAGERLVAILQAKDHLLVVQHDVVEDLPIRRRRRLPGPLGAAAMRWDGAFLALAVGRVLTLSDLRGDESQLGAVAYGQHSDDISYLRFTRDGTLFSADDDARLIIRRPHADGSYDTRAVRVAVT